MDILKIRKKKAREAGSADGEPTRDTAPDDAALDGDAHDGGALDGGATTAQAGKRASPKPKRGSTQASKQASKQGAKRVTARHRSAMTRAPARFGWTLPRAAN